MADANHKLDFSLIVMARQGDNDAMEELVCKYLPMVKHIVRRHYAPFLEFDDLVQEGYIGLLAAIQEYRPDNYNVKFSSFAYICIIRKVYNVIKHSNGYKHKVLNDAISLQSFINAEETRTMLDLISDESAVSDPFDIIEAKIVAQHIEDLLQAHLSLLEKTVMNLLLQGYSCSEIEQKIGVKAKVVDNARTRVKLKMRRLLKAYGSLMNPKLPAKARRRRDLYFEVSAGS